MRRPSTILCLATLASNSLAHAAPAPADIASFELHPSLQIQLFAAEPDIVDPVALTFDEAGRLYAVEMRDYPYGFGPDRRPGGTVRMLEDTDRDGRADRSVVFAENLSFPTSIAPWNGGVLVAAPPEILFLKDTNHDGRADVRHALLSGFELGVTDSNVNGLRWGLESRFHGSHGGNSGRIISSKKPGPPLSLRDADFSFDPASGDLITTYQSSAGFGLIFDTWGRSFGTYNINHLQQRVLPLRYRDRTPGFPPVRLTHSISDHGDMARIYPISKPETRPNHPEQSGHFSAAGGMGFIEAPWFPEDLRGCVLVCDVVGNLVHRDVLAPDGPILRASRAPSESRREFLASKDPAFRPVGLEPGPDGALYLIDMQRDVIEHPDYIPEKLKTNLNLRAGDDRGRIYRILPKSGLPAQPLAAQATEAQRVAMLAHPNPWIRFTSQRLLVEARATNTLSRLENRLADRASPLGQLHALYTLNALGLLRESHVRTALASPEPGLRENALLLAELLLPGSDSLRNALLASARDPNCRVRFQAALTLGFFNHPDRAAALRQILLQDHPHRWSRLAVLCSLHNDLVPTLESLLTNTAFLSEPETSRFACVRELSDLLAAQPAHTASIAPFVLSLGRPDLSDPWRIAALEGLAEGSKRSGHRSPGDTSLASALASLTSNAPPQRLRAAWDFARACAVPQTEAQHRALTNAIALARDPAQPETNRLDAIRLVALGSADLAIPPLLELLAASETAPIQREALFALQPHSDLSIARALVQRWSFLAPSLRPEVLDLILKRRPWHPILLDALEAGSIQTGELNLDLEQRRQLLRHSSPEIHRRAALFFSDEEYSNRKTLVTEWLAKLPTLGDPARGQPVFEKLCVTCHAVGSLGQRVGPDLSDMAHRSVEDIASNILDPNMGIQPNYLSFAVETRDGELETGLLETETRETVTLLQAQGRRAVLPRNRIQSMRSTGVSLMPEGLESGLTPQDLRDLIAFLQAPR